MRSLTQSERVVLPDFVGSCTYRIEERLFRRGRFNFDQLEVGKRGLPPLITTEPFRF
jgi:hypothetical protein